MKKEINILSRDFAPDCSGSARVITELAEGLAEKYSINVFAGKPFYGKPKFVPPYQTKGVSVKRLWCPRFNKDNILLRVLTEVVFSAILFFQLLLTKSNLNIVTSMPFGMQVVAFALKKIRGQKYIFLNFETIPEIIAAIGMMKNDGFCYKFLYWFSGKVIDNSEYSVSIGYCMSELLKKKTRFPEKIVLIQNWADTLTILPAKKEANLQIKKLGIQKKFILFFVGNFGRCVDFDSISKSALELKGDKDIAFVFVGGGQKRKVLSSLKEKNGLENIFLLGYLDKADAMNAGDVAIVSLAASAKGCIVPSKIYELMASGKPILNISPSGTETEQTVKLAKNGFNIKSGDYNSLVEAIIKLKNDKGLFETMSKNSRFFVEKNFSKKLAIGKYLDLVESVSG